MYLKQVNFIYVKKALNLSIWRWLLLLNLKKILLVFVISSYNSTLQAMAIAGSRIVMVYTLSKHWATAMLSTYSCSLVIGKSLYLVGFTYLRVVMADFQIYICWQKTKIEYNRIFSKERPEIAPAIVNIFDGNKLILWS